MQLHPGIVGRHKPPATSDDFPMVWFLVVQEDTGFGEMGGDIEAPPKKQLIIGG